MGELSSTPLLDGGTIISIPMPAPFRTWILSYITTNFEFVYDTVGESRMFRER